MHQMQNSTSPDATIILKEVGKMHNVSIKDILYCEAEGAYTTFIIEHQKPINQSHNLRYYEDLLANKGFIRTHHGSLVNIRKIKLMETIGNNCFVVMANQVRIPVSQRKKEMVKQALQTIGNMQ